MLLGLAIQPAAVIKVWKENFPHFWPKGNQFYAPWLALHPARLLC